MGKCTIKQHLETKSSDLDKKTEGVEVNVTLSKLPKKNSDSRIGGKGITALIKSGLITDRS